MSVIHTTSYNDRNHDNRHAQVGEIKFSAFPYQAYLGRWGDHLANVSDIIVGRWHVTIMLYHNDGSGRTTNVAHQGFDDRDAAFEWAAAKMIELNAVPTK